MLIGPVVAFGVALGLTGTRVAMPWGVVDLGPAGPILTVVWLVALMNALNLIDGLDGLAGGVALAGMLAFALIALIVGAATPLLVTASATTNATTGPISISRLG